MAQAPVEIGDRHCSFGKGDVDRGVGPRDLRRPRRGQNIKRGKAMDYMDTDSRLSPAELFRLQEYNTPTVYNGWEQITAHDRTGGYFNAEAVQDFMPQLGAMIGYAVTLIIEPSNPAHRRTGRDMKGEYRRYVANAPGPKIAIVQDVDKPAFVGSFWGEVNASTHRALGCVGTITDGAIRDLDEMKSLGFKALASRLCVGHAYSTPVAWECEVEIFGCKVRPGDLIHADQHGFLVIPPEDQQGLLAMVEFMDVNETNTVIRAARESAGKGVDELLASLGEAAQTFVDIVKERGRTR